MVSKHRGWLARRHLRGVRQARTRLDVVPSTTHKLHPDSRHTVHAPSLSLVSDLIRSHLGLPPSFLRLRFCSCPKMRVVFAHAHFFQKLLHMLHITHIMAFERIIVHSRLHSAFSAFGGQLHFICICIFCIRSVGNCISAAFLHSLGNCISAAYAAGNCI